MSLQLSKSLKTTTRTLSEAFIKLFKYPLRRDVFNSQIIKTEELSQWHKKYKAWCRTYYAPKDAAKKAANIWRVQRQFHEYFECYKSKNFLKSFLSYFLFCYQQNTLRNRLFSLLWSPPLPLPPFPSEPLIPRWLALPKNVAE